MSLVLDSSATLARVHVEESTEPVKNVFKRIVASGAWVPALWHLEVANVLEMSVRRGRVTPAFCDATLADLALLEIRTDPDTGKHAWGTTVGLAKRHRLTVHDAAYLELALRRGLPLATLDEELRAAAEAEGVELLGK